MSRPFNVCQGRTDKNGKTYWNKIASAWPDGKGGFNVTFDALPIPSMSEKYGLRVEAKMFPPKDDAGSNRQDMSDLNDELPDF